MKTAILTRLALCLALGSAVTGCAGARALFNVDAGWAISEPTPMSVVMHRGAVARDVSVQTDEMLRTLPTDEQGAVALAMDEPEAREKLQAAGGHKMYAAQPLRVVPAEAWKLKLATTCTEPSPDTSIIARLGPEAEAEFDKVDAMVKAAAKTKAAIALERRDARKAKGEEKDPHKEKADALKETLEQQEDELKPAMKEMLAKLQEAATALPPEDKQELAAVTFNLLAAVKDAESANAAAILRYPMALKDLTADLQPTAKRIVGDVIEEQTGTRPDTKNAQTTVGLQGGKVKLEIAGLDNEALGSLEVGTVIKETTKRMGVYVKDAFTLPGMLDETATRLLFQKRVLKAVSKGLEAPADVTKISKLKVSAAESAGTELPAVACDTPDPEEEGDAAEEELL